MDIIRISELEVYAYHGVYADEKEKGQFFYVNADLYVFIIIMKCYSFKSFSSQANALAPSTAASESFNSETSSLVLPL